MKRQGWLRCLFVVGAVWIQNPARAQQIDWRQDYAQARKEAEQTNRPLLIEFVSANCPGCDQLDAVPFRDTAVVTTLNQQFVPLRIQAERNPALTRALNIQNYPTLVVATSAGRILSIREGYMETPRFQEFLQTALPEAPAPTPTSLTHDEQMARSLAQAERALAEGHPEQALPLLFPLAKQESATPSATRAIQLVRELESRAQEQLQRGRQLLDSPGQSEEAHRVLSELVRQYPGTRAATDAAPLVNRATSHLEGKVRERVLQAREILQQARQDFRTEQYLSCLDRCELLTTQYLDLPEAAEANQLATSIKNNRAWLQQVCDNLPTRYGMLYLAMAELQLKQGQPQQAVYYLDLILQAFPNSRSAELAQIRKAQIQGGPVTPEEKETR